MGNTTKYENTMEYDNLPLSSYLHLHPLQAANCCRNSRLVVDEDDLMWAKIDQFHGSFRSKTISYRKIKCVFRDVK